MRPRPSTSAATESGRQSLEALRRRLTRESEALLAHARELWQTVQREARRADKSRERRRGRSRCGARVAEREVEALHREAR